MLHAPNVGPTSYQTLIMKLVYNYVHIARLHTIHNLPTCELEVDKY